MKRNVYYIAVTEFHVICLKDITNFTTVSHNIPTINETVTLVSHYTLSRHCTRSTVSHDTPAINHTVILVRTVLYGWKTPRRYTFTSVSHDMSAIYYTKLIHKFSMA